MINTNTINYIVLCDRRTGSTLLFNLLQKNNLSTKMPNNDHFEPFHETKLENIEFKGLDLRQLIDEQFKKYSFKSNHHTISGFKIMFHQLLLLLESYNKVNDDKIELKDILNYFPKKTKYIHITRGNKIMQAISLYKASKTGVWMEIKKNQINFLFLKDLLFSYKKTEGIIEKIAKEDIFKKITENKSIGKLELEYEVFSTDLESTLLKSLNYLGIESKDLNCDVDLKKQRGIDTKIYYYFFIFIRMLKRAKDYIN